MGRAKQLLPFEGSTVLDRILDKVVEAGFTPVLVVGGPHKGALRKAFSGRGISIVTNPAPEPGGTITSIRCGLEALGTDLESRDVEERSWQLRDRMEPCQTPTSDPLSPAATRVPGFLLHPSDFPAVSAETYTLLLDAIHASPGSIIVPISWVATGQGEHRRDDESADGVGLRRRAHHGVQKRGHPVWFPSTLLHAFMGPLPGGARELLRIYSDLVWEIPVEDPGVLLNVDTPANYAQLSRFES